MVLLNNNIWVHNKIYKYIILKNIGVINLDKRLIIIDGNSIINRAFYALPDMTNSEGLHTNAVYGFTRMLFKIIDDYKPTHISVAFDMKAPTFRHKEFSEYSTASLITRSTNDIQQIQGLIAILFRVLVYAPIIGIGGFLRVLSQSDNSMAWIIGVAILAILFVVATLFIIAMPRFKKLQELIEYLYHHQIVGQLQKLYKQ